MKPVIIALLVLVLAGTLYSRCWIRLSLLTLIVFFLIEVNICHEILVPEHRVLFWLIISINVFLPAFLITLFWLDVRYGWFCFDMSYSWAFVWGGAFVLFTINLLSTVLNFLLTTNT